MYRAVIAWRDLTNGRLYRAGETYQHEGVSPERIEMLLKRGFIVRNPNAAVKEPDLGVNSTPKAKATKSSTKSRKADKAANNAK